MSAIQFDGHAVTCTDDVKAYSPRGRMYFSPDTMRWFRSRVLSGQRIIGNRLYFITSESTDWRHEGRAYSVRYWDAETDTFDTVGEFLGFATARQARAALARISEDVATS